MTTCAGPKLTNARIAARLTLFVLVLALATLVLVFTAEFLMKDVHFLRFCFDDAPTSAVPSSTEQIQVYRWWVKQHRHGMLVIDAGCGTGSVVGALSGRCDPGNVEVCGFDIDESCISLASQKFPKHKFWVADMENFQPVSDDRPVCYIVYEPLWNCPSSYALQVYQKFFSSIVSVGGNVSVVYVSGSGVLFPKPNVFETQSLLNLGFSMAFSTELGSFFARRSCKIFTCYE